MTRQEVGMAIQVCPAPGRVWSREVDAARGDGRVLGKGILECGQRQSEPQWPWASSYHMCGGPLGMGALRISASSQGRASGTWEPPRAAPANTGSLAPSCITWVPGQVGDSPDTQPPNPQPPHTSVPPPRQTQ